MLTSSNHSGPQPVVNVTPLVDVALVVLIIFMVVTPMMVKTFWLNLPPNDAKTEAPPPSDQKPLVMTVDHAGVIRVNQTVLGRAEIAERLPRMLAAVKRPVLYFDAHDDVPYGTPSR
jgi:biopolymer transport protein ExbD